MMITFFKPCLVFTLRLDHSSQHTLRLVECRRHHARPSDPRLRSAQSDVHEEHFATEKEELIMVLRKYEKNDNELFNIL